MCRRKNVFFNKEGSDGFLERRRTRRRRKKKNSKKQLRKNRPKRKKKKNLSISGSGNVRKIKRLLSSK